MTKKISSQYWQIKIENIRRNKLTKWAKNKLKLGKFVKVVLVVMVPDIPVGLYKFARKGKFKKKSFRKIVSPNECHNK